MKKIIGIVLVLALLATVLTGCIRFKETIKLDEDGKISVTVLTAFLTEEPEEGEAPLTEEDDYSALEEVPGCTVEAYSDDEGYKGSIIRFEGDVKNAGGNNASIVPEEFNAIEMSMSDGFILDGDRVILTFASSSGDELGGMEGYEDMVAESGAVMELEVDFPFAAIETNATAISDDKKVLTWDMLSASSVYAIYQKADFEEYFGKDYNYQLVNPFTDIEFGTYYYNAVLWAYVNGVTTGTTATTFSPASTCTRGQVVTFLWRALGEPEPETEVNPFTDVKESDYYYKPILWAVEKGITNGTTATTFSPANTCSNAHILTFIYRAIGEPMKTGEGEWYDDAVTWAEELKVTADTYENEFDPALPCPRSDVVTFLNRALRFYTPAEVEDIGE